MKLIHTSDWHLGHTLYSYNREDEFRDFISQLVLIVEKEQPDGIIISGDIFDSAIPTLSARRLWTDALIELKAAARQMFIIATAGNHDSGSNLDVTAPLLKDDYHIIGRHTAFIRIEDKNGQGLVVCAVPFITENGFRSRLPECLQTVNNPRKAYYEWKLEEAGKLAHAGDIIVLMAHEAVSDSLFHGQEKYSFNFAQLENFGNGYNYLALGHIHCPQTVYVSEERIAAYSGSPLPMSFDEDYPHSVTVIEFKDGPKAPFLRRIDIKPFRQMLTLPEKETLKDSDVENYVRSLLENGTKGYLRLNVSSSRPLPSLQARLRNMLADTELRFCLIKYSYETESEQDTRNRVPQISIQDLKTIDPMTLALDYYRRKTGTDMDDEMRKSLLDIIRDRD